MVTKEQDTVVIPVELWNMYVKMDAYFCKAFRQDLSEHHFMGIVKRIHRAYATNGKLLYLKEYLRIELGVKQDIGHYTALSIVDIYESHKPEKEIKLVMLKE